MLHTGYAILHGMIKGMKVPANEIWMGLPAKKYRNRGEKVKENRWKDDQEKF